MADIAWLECTNPKTMWEFLRFRLSDWDTRRFDRKMRLFAVACCRRMGSLLTDERSRKAVEVAERYADNNADDTERIAACLDAADAADARRDHQAPHIAFMHEAACEAACATCGELPKKWEVPPPITLALEASRLAAIALAAWSDEPFALSELQRAGGPLEATPPVNHPSLVEQCRLIRDIFCNPFRPVTINPTWLAWQDGTVPNFAQAIYGERAFDRLPVLADALEDAGCTDADILGHCRGAGLHTRGCWVVDAILGRM